MMGKYREMKAAHPDALYIFRNGESCELYEDDAIAASGILGIATAERVDGQGKGVKELRFSFRDLDVYLPKTDTRRKPGGCLRTESNRFGQTSLITIK